MFRGRRSSRKMLVVVAIIAAATVALGPPAQGAVVTPNPLAGNELYVMPNNDAQQAMAKDPSLSPTLEQISGQPTSYWIVPQIPDVLNQSYVDSVQTAATAANRLPVFVLYAIPYRDCNSYSGGGEPTDASYVALVNLVKSGIAGRRAVVIVEPDALVQAPTCLNSLQARSRLADLSYAVTTLAVPGTTVYLEAGNWNSKGTSAASLSYLMSALPAAGIGRAAGVALNTSAFWTTADEQAFGDSLSSQLDAAGYPGKHYVIDTSRNGNGPGPNTSGFCNLPGLALGVDPTTSTGHALADAFLWLKYPGESDGACSGNGTPDANAPRSGVFWPSYAVKLVQNRATLRVGGSVTS